MSRVSVVIPTRGRADLIARSVRAVLANDHPEFEVIVVDQSDDDRTGEIVRALARTERRLRYVHTLPPGLSRAYNVGVRLTTSPIIAFTDDDCVAARDWISSVARAFDDDPAAEMLYGTVALPRELAGRAGEVPILPIEHAERLHRRNGFRIYGMGANYALRRSLFERVGGFDEILGGGGPLRSSQDFDFQFRAYRAGAVVLLRPEVTVDHYGLRTPEQWPATLRAYCIGNAAFYVKHIRCGDRVAAVRLSRSVFKLLVRQVRHLIDQRRPSQAEHLRAYLDGARESLRYPIDRARRLYRPRGPASA
jgi:glycosyltransferase involved in cell wall biosynthesis